MESSRQYWTTLCMFSRFNAPSVQNLVLFLTKPLKIYRSMRGRRPWAEFPIDSPLHVLPSEELPEGNRFLSGYEDKFVNAVDEDLLCPICKLPLRSPVVTSCGHRFCKGCIDELCKRSVLSVLFPLFLQKINIKLVCQWHL